MIRDSVLAEIKCNPSVIFRPFLEDGSIRGVFNTSGGDANCFRSFREAKLFMHRSYGYSSLHVKYPYLKSQKDTKYEIWAFHVGKDDTYYPWFPPTLVYTHEPKS